MKDEATASMDDAKASPILKPREKIPVNTTEGTLYVRHLLFVDISKIAEFFKMDPPALADAGRAVLLRLTSMTSASEDKTEVDKAIFNSLNEQDLRSLATTIAKESHLGALAEGDSLTALGRAVQEEIKRATKEFAKTFAEVKRSWDSKFVTLPETIRAALQSSLIGIDDISKRLRESSAVEFFQKSFVESTPAIEQYLRANKTIIDATNSSDVGGNVITADGKPGSMFNRYFPPPIELPDFETLPIGRAAKATEEMARQITEVAGLLGEMGARIGELSTTIVGTAVPEWMKNLEGDRESTRKTLDQARNSLRWTKWAVIVSVLVTMLMTGWQVWLAREYKLDNDRQQNAIESLLRGQLEVAQQFRKQAAEDADKARALFDSLATTQKEKISPPQPKISHSKSDGK